MRRPSGRPGGNLGAYLGLLTSPSGMSSANTFRLDSWWIEKRWLDERITCTRGAVRGVKISTELNTMRQSLSSNPWLCVGNLFNTFESFDPPSTPAMEIRVVPVHNLYVNRWSWRQSVPPFSQNPTRPGSAFQRNASECLRDRLYSGHGGRRPCEPLTMSRAERDTRASISSGPPIIPESSRRQRVRPLTVRQLPLILDGKPKLSGASTQRRKGVGWDFCIRLEPPAHQPKQHHG